jgi:hypothetical protein
MPSQLSIVVHRYEADCATVYALDVHGFDMGPLNTDISSVGYDVWTSEDGNGSRRCARIVPAIPSVGAIYMDELEGSRRLAVLNLILP